MSAKKSNKMLQGRVPRAVAIWLAIGVFMVIMQVQIGGITRLTNSGLSITEWNLIGGVIPPTSDAEWMEAFQKYKDHTIQAEKLHADMTLSGFKFIYFWEWFHRLFARSLGFVFIIPFFFFLYKRWFSRKMLMKLLTLVALGGVVGVFGWIMVKSGLNNDKLAWVNAYKLTMHLGLALIVYSYLLWLTYQAFQPVTLDNRTETRSLRTWARWILGFGVIQILLGGVMSGMKAGLLFHYFPVMESGAAESLTMSGSYIPHVMMQPAEWNIDNFADYQANSFAPAFINFFHRATAYLLTVLVAIFFFKTRRSAVASARLKTGSNLLLVALLVQVSLGIYTLINCIGSVPAAPGVLHQTGAIFFLSVVLFVNYQFSKGGLELIPGYTPEKQTTPAAPEPVVTESPKPADQSLDYDKGVSID